MDTVSELGSDVSAGKANEETDLMMRTSLLVVLLGFSWCLTTLPASAAPSARCSAHVQEAISRHVDCLLDAASDSTLSHRVGRLAARQARCDGRFEKRFARALKRNRRENCTVLRASEIAEANHAFVEQAVAASRSETRTRTAILLLPSSRNDLNFSEASFQGALRAIPDGWRLKVVENTGARPEAEWREEFLSHLDQGADLILATGVEYGDLLVEVMAENLELRVASVPTGPSGVDSDRLLVLPLDRDGIGGLLAGDVAVPLTNVGRVAFIGGIEAVDGPEGNAFVERINEIAPDIIVDLRWVGAFGDPALTTVATNEAIDAGADVVLAGADTITAQIASDRGVKSIGWVHDPRDSGSTLTEASAAVRFDVVWRQVVNWVETGERPSAAESDPVNFWKATLYPHY